MKPQTFYWSFQLRNKFNHNLTLTALGWHVIILPITTALWIWFVVVLIDPSVSSGHIKRARSYKDFEVWRASDLLASSTFEDSDSAGEYLIAIPFAVISSNVSDNSVRLCVWNHLLRGCRAKRYESRERQNNFHCFFFEIRNRTEQLLFWKFAFKPNQQCDTW